MHHRVKVGILAIWGVLLFGLLATASGSLAASKTTLKPKPTSQKITSTPTQAKKKTVKKATPTAKQKAASSTVALPAATKANPPADQPPLLLKNLGINLDEYDPATGMAGDLKFTKGKLQFDVPFTQFGFVIPGSQSSTRQDKTNPQPTWQVPLGTKVHAIIDGIVLDIPTLYSGDVSIMMGVPGDNVWRYETEHVINPTVKIGDTVKAGDIIAEVSPHNKDGNGGLGLVEIGILKGGTKAQHVCPFAYLDPTVKDDLTAKLKAFYQSWNDYKGKTLYDLATEPIPGCLTLDAIDG